MSHERDSAELLSSAVEGELLKDIPNLLDADLQVESLQREKENLFKELARTRAERDQAQVGLKNMLEQQKALKTILGNEKKLAYRRKPTTDSQVDALFDRIESAL